MPTTPESKIPTPRTDALINNYAYKKHHSDYAKIVDLARQLERELAQARDKLEYFNKPEFQQHELYFKLQGDNDHHKRMWEGQINRTKLAESERDEAKSLLAVKNEALRYFASHGLTEQSRAVVDKALSTTSTNNLIK